MPDPTGCDKILLLTKWLAAREHGFETSAGLDRQVEAILEELARLMPAKIRVPRWALEPEAPGKGRWANGESQARRDEKIRQWHAWGMSYGKLARHFNIDRASVQKVVRSVA